MFGDDTNHSHNTVALNDLALVAYFFDACPNFHIQNAFLVRLYLKSEDFGPMFVDQTALIDASREHTSGSALLATLFS